MATEIDERFLIDSHFFEDSIKTDFVLQEQLTYITSKASGNKRTQNAMSAKTRDSILTANRNMSEEVLRYFLNGQRNEKFEQIDDETERTLKYAYDLTYYWPFKVVVFTNAAMVAKYKANKHYQEVKSIRFLHGEEAKELISYWYKLCREEKLTNC